MMRESNGESFEKTWKDLWQNHVLKNSKCESNTSSVSDLAKCHTAMGIKSFVSIIEFNPPWTTGFCIYVHLLANIMHVSSPFCWIPTKRTTYCDLPIAQQDWQQQSFLVEATPFCSRNPQGLNEVKSKNNILPGHSKLGITTTFQQKLTYQKHHLLK